MLRWHLAERLSLRAAGQGSVLNCRKAPINGVAGRCGSG